MVEEDTEVIAKIIESTDDITTSKILIYPNPPTQLVIAKGYDFGSQIESFYLDGHAIYNYKTTHEDEERIDVSGLSAGTYILSVIERYSS